MSGSESERPDDAPAFVESDERETKLPYDNGGLPIYVALGWAVFGVTYVVVMWILALPDLRRWLAH